MSNRPSDPDADAIRRARRLAPERTTAETLTLREGGDLPADDPVLSGDDVGATEDATLHEWAAAEDALPDLSDENEDGLSELDEEVQRQAEAPVSLRRSRRR